VAAAAAATAPHIAAHPGERLATGRMQDTKAGPGTDSATIMTGPAAATATAAGDFRAEEEEVVGIGKATAPSSMADSTAIAAAGAERFK
jgi:hypothetical protein